MELKQLEYFMVACEKGSFNQAACDEDRGDGRGIP